MTKLKKILENITANEAVSGLPDGAEVVFGRVIDKNHHVIGTVEDGKFVRKTPGDHAHDAHEKTKNMLKSQGFKHKSTHHGDTASTTKMTHPEHGEVVISTGPNGQELTHNKKNESFRSNGKYIAGSHTKYWEKLWKYVSSKIPGATEEDLDEAEKLYSSSGGTRHATKIQKEILNILQDKDINKKIRATDLQWDAYAAERGM